MTTSYEQVHAKRYAISLEWLKPHLKQESEVIDFGGRSAFTEKLGPLVAHASATSHDLRYANHKSGVEWDVVLCMEVLEHINDQDGMNAEWQGDGARTILAEAFRSLKPGGILFLTTPNAASITVLHHTLRLAPPMIYRPHVREYAPYELDELVRAAGFEILRRETLDVWLNAISPDDHARLKRFAEQSYPQFDAKLRGEDIFLLARRPF